MLEQAGYLSAFIVGLLGGVHCVGMCGGIVGALTFGLPEEKRTRIASMLPFQFAYNLGRMLSYVVAGAIMGGLGMLLAEAMPVYYAQRILLGVAGLFMIFLGLYLGGWWMGLVKVEKLGGTLWKRIEPLGRKFMPVQRPRQALVLGMLWGWIPCGLVYSMLIWTVSAGSALKGAGLMLAFGLGTLPNLFAMGLLAGGIARWSRKPWVRSAAGLTVIAFGLWTLAGAIGY